MESTQTQRFVSLITKDTLALVLAGGRGSRLGALTRRRVKPAVPFGGRYRIIDFTLSNCVNSGVRRIGVLTQYKAHSLIQHLQRGWSWFHPEFGEFVELLPAQQRIGDTWYKGTADAVYQNADIIRHHDPRFVMVLGGDHVYKMDYGAMLGFHLKRGADVTVGCIPVPLAQASAFGVMQVDGKGHVVEFEEKPESPKPMPDQPDMALVSMGIYIFNADFLLERLDADSLDTHSSHDFGKDIIPHAVRDSVVCAFAFRDAATDGAGYWRDVGDIDSYWRANMELLDVQPELNLYDRQWPIWTLQEQTPPAKFVFDNPVHRGMAIGSMIAGGCIVSGARVIRSLLFSSVVVEQGSSVEDSLLLPDVYVGRDCRIRRAILDNGCRIPDGTVIGEDTVADAARFHVSPGGVVLVTPEHFGLKLPDGV